MRKRYVGLSVALVVLAGALAGYVARGAQLYQRYHLAYANYSFVPDGPCGALVAWSPPTVVYTALYVNQPSLVTLRYRSPTPQTLRLSVSIPPLTDEQTREVQAAQAFQQVSFWPPLAGADALNSLISPGQRAAQIRLRVHGAGGDCTVTAPVQLKSPEYMLWRDPATGADNTDDLAGWVTENAPAVQRFIGHATDYLAKHPADYPALAGVVGLPGYAGQPSSDATAQAARAQVDLLFDTLQKAYHVRYANDNALYNGGEQRIQLPSEVLGSPYPVGMCVETTVTLASAVMRLGMRPYIVILPNEGHAFLGVALGPGENAPVEYWETSDLNGASGLQANVNGENEFTRAKAKGEPIVIVDVTYERGQGINPIE
jgi:hypothetical protein